MYFKEKEETNIDSEFESNKKFNFDFKNINKKTLLFIGGGILLLIIILILIFTLTGNSDKYTLELLGETAITINEGDDYIEPGYKAYDKKNNDYTYLVDVTSNVNTDKVGEYEVLYSIGKVSKVRYVYVVKGIEDTYIKLKGEANMYLEVGEKYTEPGYEVYDSIDKDLTEKVKVTGSINTSKIGTYQITYTVVNSRNETVTVKRTIIVVEKGKKPQN